MWHILYFVKWKIMTLERDAAAAFCYSIECAGTQSSFVCRGLPIKKLGFAQQAPKSHAEQALGVPGSSMEWTKKNDRK